ncbi:MAG: hypothetical protein HC898_04515 [Phycisphaerales bacterium]|nr:hypothetical protein [Phycisphaerales bacterium]
MLPTAQRREQSEHAARIIAQTGNGLLGCALADPNLPHDHPPTQAGGY